MRQLFFQVAIFITMTNALLTSRYITIYSDISAADIQDSAKMAVKITVILGFMIKGNISVLDYKYCESSPLPSLSGCTVNAPFTLNEFFLY